MKCLLCSSDRTTAIIESQNYSIYGCKNCNNAFTFPPPKPPHYENKDFHSKDLATDQLISKRDLPWEWQKSLDMQVNLIEKHIGEGKEVLEIGCGEGILAGELINKGFNITAIEPSFSACERAKKRHIEVYQGYFPHASIKKQFDIIIMTHVLEHMETPIKVFGDIKTYAKKNALLLLVQTNFKGLMPKYYKEKWYAWVPEEHFWHFTPSGLKFIAKSAGFKFVKNEYSSLVHSRHGVNKVNLLTKFVPCIRDQFHILFRIK